MPNLAERLRLVDLYFRCMTLAISPGPIVPSVLSSYKPKFFEVCCRLSHDLTALRIFLSFFAGTFSLCFFPRLLFPRLLILIFLPPPHLPPSQRKHRCGLPTGSRRTQPPPPGFCPFALHFFSMSTPGSMIRKNYSDFSSSRSVGLSPFFFLVPRSFYLAFFSAL